MFDSWLYDEAQPFLHVEATETFAFLKAQVDKGYFEQLIQKYLLDNTHGAIVVVKPEKGRTARLDKELEEKLQSYKDSLSKEEVKALVAATHQLLEYQEEEDALEEEKSASLS
jgi:Zn-dependent M16 (insulinase) family peptidase